MFSFFLLPVRFFLSVRRKSNSVTTSTQPLLFLSNYNWRISGPRQTKHTHTRCAEPYRSTKKVANATEPTPVDGKPNFLDFMSAPRPYGRDYVFGEIRFTDRAKDVSYMYLYVTRIRILRGTRRNTHFERMFQFRAFSVLVRFRTQPRP